MAGTPSGSRGSGSAGAAVVVAVCISPGGVPKLPVDAAEVTLQGLVGDGHDHEKHCRPERAVLIQDGELLEELKAGGCPVGPGVMGENLVVRGLHVQRLSSGDRLYFQDGPVLELTGPRKPCFVLDEIRPGLEHVVAGRCGFLAKVINTGRFFPGQRITVAVKGS